MLSHACSSTCLPLDLSDEALLSRDLLAAATELDSHGWNKYNRIYSTIILWSHTMFAKIRHEILELVQASLDAPPEQLGERAMCVFLTDLINILNIRQGIKTKNTWYIHTATRGDHILLKQGRWCGHSRVWSLRINTYQTRVYAQSVPAGTSSNTVKHKYHQGPNQYKPAHARNDLVFLEEKGPFCWSL